MKSKWILPKLKPGIPGDPGLVGPSSLVWPVASEKVVVLGGATALLLQLANPPVASGVAEHSRFEDDPLKRLLGTLQAVLVTIYGDTEQAVQMGERVARIHRHVQGVKNGVSYSAFSPELCLWVYATLVEVALDVYSMLIRPLSVIERSAYFEQTKPVAKLFYVTDNVMPGSYAEFHRYYQDMCATLPVTDQAGEVADSLFKSRFFGLPINHFAKVVAAGFLPSDRLRIAYGLKWTRVTRFEFRTIILLAKLTARILPRRARTWQHARVAMDRVAEKRLQINK